MTKTTKVSYFSLLLAIALLFSIQSTIASEVTGTLSSGTENTEEAAGSITGNVTGGVENTSSNNSNSGSSGTRTGNRDLAQADSGTVLGASTTAISSPSFPNAGAYGGSLFGNIALLLITLFVLLAITLGLSKLRRNEESSE